MKTKKTEFKRELIHENLDILEKITKQSSQFVPCLEDLKAKYEALQISKFTDEVFKELLRDGTLKVGVRYHEYLNNEMDKTGVTSTLIRDNMIKESNEQLKSLKSSLQTLKSFRPHLPWSVINIPELPIELITYGNRSERFYIADEEGEIIAEKYCRTYLENQMEKDGYEAICKLAEGYAEFLEVTKDIRSVDFKGLLSLGDFITDPAIAPKDHPDHRERPAVKKERVRSYLAFNPHNIQNR